MIGPTIDELSEMKHSILVTLETFDVIDNEMSLFGVRVGVEGDNGVLIEMLVGALEQNDFFRELMRVVVKEYNKRKV